MNDTKISYFFYELNLILNDFLTKIQIFIFILLSQKILIIKYLYTHKQVFNFRIKNLCNYVIYFRNKKLEIFLGKNNFKLEEKKSGEKIYNNQLKLFLKEIKEKKLEEIIIFFLFYFLK